MGPNGAFPSTPITPVIPVTEGVTVLSPVLVSLDWLTVGMSAPVPNPFDGPEPFEFRSHLDGRKERFWCIPKAYGTPVFSRVTELLNSERTKVVTIAHTPRMRDKPSDWCHVQFANETLYTGQWVNLFGMLRGFGFTLIGISRVDISADGVEGEGGDYLAVMDRRMKGELKFYGKGNWTPYMERDNLTGFRMGTTISDKYVRCYNKTREMKKRGMKPWIVNSWAQAMGGLDVYGNGIEMQRFEAQLKGKGIRRYVGTKERDAAWIESLNTPQVRTSLFASMATGLFDFRKPAARARDAAPALAWDFSRVCGEQLTIDERAPRNYLLTPEEVKRGLRYVFVLAMGMSDPGTMENGQRMAAAYSADMAEWFARKRREWFKQYGKMLAGGDAATLTFFANLAQGRDNSPGAIGEAFGLE